MSSSQSAAAVGKGTEVLQKSKKSITTRPIPGRLSKECEKIYAPHVHCSIIYNSHDMEATQASMVEWMDKEGVVMGTSVKMEV